MLEFGVEIPRTTKRERSDWDSARTTALCLLDENDTAVFLFQIESGGLKTEVLEVLGGLEKEAASIELTAFERFLLPLVRNLIRL